VGSQIHCLFDYDRYGCRQIDLRLSESLLYHKTLLKSLEKDSRVAQLFNTDLSHVQQYLFTKLKIEPTSKVEIYSMIRMNQGNKNNQNK
jgi:hypothetical protein